MSDLSILGHFQLPSQGPLSRGGSGGGSLENQLLSLLPTHSRPQGTRDTNSLAAPGGYGQSPSVGTSASESGAHSAAGIFSISPTI